MSQELVSLGLHIGKYVFASAMLAIFYLLFYRKKTSYNSSRFYLLSIGLVAILLSQFTVTVYTPPLKIVEIEDQSSYLPSVLSAQTVMVGSETANVKPKSESNLTDNKFLSWFLSKFTVTGILSYIYIIITSVFFLLFLMQLLKIQRFKSKGEVVNKGNVKVIVHSKIPTPFSFCKSIFINEKLTGSKLEMILKHEQWHIFHRHYIDVFIIEIMVRIFWFNPVLWWVRRELRNIHEFQTDRSVLDEGHDIYKYQTIILEEVMENNSYLANSFNSSFTKKRFIIMKNKTLISSSKLRHVLIFPFMLAVFSLLSFTQGEAQVKYVAKKEIKQNQLTNLILNGTLTLNDSLTDNKKNFSQLELDSADVRNFEQLKQLLGDSVNVSEKLNEGIDLLFSKINVAQTELNLLLKNNRSITQEDLSHIYRPFLMSTMGVPVDKIKFSNEFLSSITKADLKSLYNDLSSMKSNISVLKNETSDQKKNSALLRQNRLLFMNTLTRKISDEVRKQQKDEVSKQQTFTVHSYGTLKSLNSVVMDSSVLVFPAASSRIRKNSESDTKIWNEAYRAKPDQIVVSNIPYNYDNKTTVCRIEKLKKETKVTLAIPIVGDEWWIYFDRGFTIIDKRNQDRYLIRRIANGFPLDKTIIVSNNSGKMIEVTLIFPPLPKAVNFVDIIEFNSPDAVKMSNGGGLWQFLNIQIAGYSGKVYR